MLNQMPNKTGKNLVELSPKVLLRRGRGWNWSASYWNSASEDGENSQERGKTERFSILARRAKALSSRRGPLLGVQGA